MNILGIYDGHNSNSALIQDGKIIKAVEEERFSRVKNHDGRREDLTTPFESIKYCLSEINNRPDAIALALDAPKTIHARAINSYFESVYNGFYKRLYCDEIKGKRIDAYSMLMHPIYTQTDRIGKIIKYLQKANIDIDNIPIYYVNHHLAHVSSAYYTSPYDDVLIITLDGKGDDLCGMVALGRDGKLEVIHEVNYIHSIGHLYSAITVLCGFQAVRHEGIITGLAAYAKPHEDLLRAFRDLIIVENGKWYSKLNKDNKIGPYPHTMFKENINLIKQMCMGLSREDMAATIQFFTEEQIQKFIRFYIEKYRGKTVLLAGGVFANVKVNQRVKEIAGVENIYIHPAMSDAGLGVGAALKVYYDSHPFEGYSFNSVFFGPEYRDEEIRQALEDVGLNYTCPDNIEKILAKLLADGKLIARFVGRMEYGPRALGNRSILYKTTDITINDWLNKRLERTEFMPFAPITLHDCSHECYKNCEGGEHTAQFMTITYDCTEKMKKQSPAVVHIDGTARPQLITFDNNPTLYKILKKYYEITGIPSLVNTSFNVHEEPIVCSPSDAIRSFQHCHFDYMQMGPFFISPKDL
jgi:carbamoyltransferase